MTMVPSLSNPEIRLASLHQGLSTMKVGFVVASVSRKAGGLFESVRRLAQSLDEQACRVRVFSAEDEFSAADRNTWQPLEPVTFRVFGPRQFGYTPELARALRAPA